MGWYACRRCSFGKKYCTFFHLLQKGKKFLSQPISVTFLKQRDRPLSFRKMGKNCIYLERRRKGASHPLVVIVIITKGDSSWPHLYFRQNQLYIANHIIKAIVILSFIALLTYFALIWICLQKRHSLKRIVCLVGSDQSYSEVLLDLNHPTLAYKSLKTVNFLNQLFFYVIKSAVLENSAKNQSIHHWNIRLRILVCILHILKGILKALSNYNITLPVGIDTSLASTFTPSLSRCLLGLAGIGSAKLQMFN